MQVLSIENGYLCDGFFVRRATIMEKPVARRTKLVAQNGGQIFHDRHCEIICYDNNNAGSISQIFCHLVKLSSTDTLIEMCVNIASAKIIIT